MEIKKLEVAPVHLQVAIDMFLTKKDLFCVITLAGAAEEILGQYALRANETKIIDLLCSSLKDEYSIGLPDSLFKKSYLNKAKNILKHFDHTDSEIIEIEPENEAITMLLRAIGNLYSHDKSLTHNTPKFLLWLIENRKEFFPTNKKQKSINKTAQQDNQADGKPELKILKKVGGTPKSRRRRLS